MHVRTWLFLCSAAHASALSAGTALSACSWPRPQILTQAARSSIRATEADDCLLDPDAAIGAVQDAATANIIAGAARGGSFGDDVVKEAAKIKRATAAAAAAAKITGGQRAAGT